jgi:acyl carrier protein
MTDDRLKTLIADVMGVKKESVGDDASPTTVATWDSLRQMNLILALEEEFGVRFGDAELSTLTSLSAIRSALRAKGAG